ncbi:MAG: SDR family NAD(P)-dependent oxidoreductase [Verrucomicrobia bacterium]|nr:SDR family NAD(P)-dependent oxidoreductase [Verrucomicrobiota bacterium]
MKKKPLPSSSPVALVTGAGSGVGRAVVQKLAAEGWQVALVGRRAEALAATIALVPAAARRRLAAFACDIGEVSAVEKMCAAVTARFGRVDAFINAAGTNTPRRSWSELPLAAYHELMAANLHGPFHCVQALLPAMRARRSGTFVFINSEAGLKASPKAGVAYVASKFGLTGLAQSLNAEERPHGLRACSIFPGDIDTDILNKRPVPPSPEARAKMMRPEDVAACVWLAVSLPPRAVVEELLVRPL